jgi:hypothetical protein
MSYSNNNNNCTSSCWTTTPYSCQQITISTTYTEEICICHNTAKTHDVFLLHQTHTCEVPTWWLDLIWWFYFALTVINIFRIMRAWDRLQTGNTSGDNNNNTSSSSQIRALLFHLIGFQTFFVLAIFGLWIQNGYYEICPTFMFCATSIASLLVLRLADALLVPIPLSAFVKLRFKSSRTWATAMFISGHFIFTIFVISTSRALDYRNIYNWLIFSVSTWVQFQGLFLLFMVRGHVVSLLQLLPREEASRQNNPNLYMATMALQQFHRYNRVLISTVLFPIPWLISYIAIGVAPYFFLITSVNWCVFGTILTSGVIRFCGMLISSAPASISSLDNQRNNNNNNNGNARGSPSFVVRGDLYESAITNNNNMIELSSSSFKSHRHHHHHHRENDLDQQQQQQPTHLISPQQQQQQPQHIPLNSGAALLLSSSDNNNNSSSTGNNVINRPSNQHRYPTGNISSLSFLSSYTTPGGGGGSSINNPYQPNNTTITTPVHTIHVGDGIEIPIFSRQQQQQPSSSQPQRRNNNSSNNNSDEIGGMTLI